MAALVWDNQSQAFVDAKTPTTYNPQLEAWEESNGYEYNHGLGAWEERWSPIISGMPQTMYSGKTLGGSPGAATSDSVDISRIGTLSGKWTVQWYEQSRVYPNYQQGYGEIIADGIAVLNTGNCTHSNQDYSDNNDNGTHFKYGTFSIDISAYSSLCVRAVATKSFSNWYHMFSISELVWTR